MTTGVRKNPKTGQLETYEVSTPTVLELEKSRKELRDMIHGNVQWHVDPLSKPKEEPVQEVL